MQNANYKKNFDDLFDKLNHPQNSVIEPNWLIYAETHSGSSFTKSNIEGYKQYTSISAYSEELKIANNHAKGEGGIICSNIKIIMTKNQNSIEFFNKFSGKTILNKIELLELITNEGKLKTQQIITYKNCKIASYKNNMNTVELTINYTTRNDKYCVFSHGSKEGNKVSW